MIKRQDLKKNLRKYELAMVIVLVLALPLLFFKTSITGFVSSDIQRQIVNITLHDSKVLQMLTLSGQPAALSYLSLSGNIIGDGDVAIYLTNKRYTLLVYGNIGNPDKHNLITGFATGSGESEAGTGKNMYNDTIVLREGGALDWPGDIGYNTGEKNFSRTCLETCFLDPTTWTSNKWNLYVYLEPGTNLSITEMGYAVELG